MIYVNENYFDVIDTEEKAYWLGFIWADGYSARKSTWFLCIQIKDIEHLEKFVSTIKYDGHIKFPKNSGSFSNSSKMGRLTICRKYLCDRINLLGRNNIDLRIPDIPKDLKRHFIRGYFDGDGSVYTYNKSSFVGSKRYYYNWIECSIIGQMSLLTDINNELINYGIKTRYKKSKTDYMKYLVVSNKTETIKMFNYLYDNSSVFIERKFKVWQNYFAPLDSNI